MSDTRNVDGRHDESAYATEPLTLASFIAAEGITLHATRTDHNPHMADSASMDHWAVTLRRGKQRMSLVFSVGAAWRGGQPTPAQILECLASDARTVGDSNSFEEWAGDLGYDVDSRKAEKTFRAILRQAGQLRRFLGDASYQRLMGVER